MTLSSLLLSTLLAQAAAPEVATAAAPAAPPPPAWTGTVGLSLISLTGNSQTLTFATNAALERKSTDWIWGAKAFAAYGRSTVAGATSSLTALNAGGQARGDRRFNEQLSLYLMAGIDTDHLKSIEYRPFGEIGASMIWFDNKEGDFSKSSFKTDLGFRYGREYRFDYYPAAGTPRLPPSEVDVVAPRLGAAFRYAFNKDVIFTEDVSALFNVAGAARLLFSSTSKLSAHLTEKMTLGVGFVLQDDTVPAPGKVSTDTALTVGLDIAI
jgi:hypothetical protein